MRDTTTPAVRCVCAEACIWAIDQTRGCRFIRERMPRLLEPLPQHLALVAWLKAHEPEVWDWYADEARQVEHAEQIRLSLLRDTYRMDAAEHAEIFAEVEAAKAALGLTVPVQVYQAQGQTAPNAALCHLPGEAHLIFSGPILSLLSPLELRAVIGHELAHYLLWELDDGAYYRADRILEASAAHDGAHPSHGHSARLWRMITELYADRGAFLATDSLEAAVGGLVKTTTGLANLSARSYLAQAAEIFSKSRPRTEEYSHPETFMRARALDLWVQEDDDLLATVTWMLDLDDSLDSLTVTDQTQLTQHTRRFLAQFLRPVWFQSQAVLGHARLYFPDFQADAERDRALAPALAELPAPQREFLGQVMIDFCAVDPDLEDAPVIAALAWARELEILGAFEKMVTRDLKIKARDLKRLKEKSTAPTAGIV